MGADPGRDRRPPPRRRNVPAWQEEVTAPRRSSPRCSPTSGIAIAKFVGFVITGSASMLAEAIHSVADSGNQGLLLLGGHRARRKADETHPFGYGRERYFWAFIVALVLFSLGGAFAIFEGVEKIRHPHEIESAGVAIAILLFAIALETFSFRTAIVESNKVRGDASWWQFVRRSKNPELPVVLLEDLGAEVGLFIALGAVSTSIITDDPIYDGIGTLLIGLLLTVIAVILAIEMKSLLMGETADPKVQEAIRAGIEAEPEVDRLIHLRTQHIGPDELLIGAKVAFVDGLSVSELAAAVNRVEANVRRRRARGARHVHRARRGRHRPAGRPASQPDARARRPRRPIQLQRAASRQTARAAPRGERRRSSREVPLGGLGLGRVCGGAGLRSLHGGLGGLLGLVAGHRGHRLEDGGDDRGVGVDQLLDEGGLRLARPRSGWGGTRGR